jgi:CRISPR-associated protein Cas1
MPTLYLTEQYSTVKKNGDCIVVQPPAWTRDKGKATGADEAHTETPAKAAGLAKVGVPLVKIDHVVVMGNVTMTAPALYMLLENDISVCYLSAHGRYLGQLDPAFSKNAPLRIAQHQAHNDPARRVALARACVDGKLRNMRALLLRAARTRTARDADLGAAAAVLKESQRRAAQAANVPELLGHEGTGSAGYFGVFGSLLREGWEFKGRVRRPPTDPVNALLSFGYALLTSQVSAAVQLVGLDPFVGYLHVARYGRPALALDLIEEFRAPIVDSVVLTVINNRILSPDDFTTELGAVSLTESGRRTYLRRFEERLTTEIVHPTFGYKATYRRCLELQVRLLAKTLVGEIEDYPPFVVR